MIKPIPDGYSTITPHLVVPDGAKAIEFYKKALGAQENGRMMSPDGKAVMHAEIKIGNSIVMLGNEFPPSCLSPKARGGTSVSLYTYVENADASFDRAVKAGCTVKMPMTHGLTGLDIEHEERLSDLGRSDGIVVAVEPYVPLAEAAHPMGIDGQQPAPEMATA